VSDDVLNPRLAERLARAAQAAQALSETLWEALHEELSDPREQRVAELSQRLADVSATVVSLARVDAEPSSPQPSPRTDAPARTRGGEDPDRPTVPESSAAHVVERQQDEPAPPRESPAAQESSSAAVLIDEFAPAEPAPKAPPEIEIRDERHEESRRERVHGDGGPTAWIESIGRRLERYEQDGAGFAVLLIELADVERLRHAELPGEVARLTGLVETALSGALRPADSLARESPGRYWLLTPETSLDSARTLAGSLAHVVRRAAGHRGAPLEVAVGIAVCPEDGRQASALAAHADIALYAARAAGLPIV
jgi:GGDEF domain-containing protein